MAKPLCGLRRGRQQGKEPSEKGQEMMGGSREAAGNEILRGDMGH